MKKIRVEDAVGQTLCHDMTAILENGFKGVKFKRGHVITEEDIPALLDIGKSHIFVWLASWPMAQSGQLLSPFSLASAVCCA